MFKKKYIQIAVCFFAMFVMAISSGLRGMLVPTLMKYFQVGNAEIGLLFSVATAISIPAAYLTAISNRKYGLKTTVLIGLILSGLTYLTMTKFSSYAVFMVGYSLMTVGTTFIVVGLSTLVTVIKVPWQAVLVNMIHFFFGFGFALSQKVTGPMIVGGMSWQQLFFYQAMLFFIASVLIFVTMLPQAESEQVKGKFSAVDNKLYLYLLTIALSFYVGAELQTGNWLVNYMVSVYHENEAQAGLYSAIFFGTFSVGRLLGGFIAEKLGYLRSVGSFLIASAVLYTFGMLLGESGMMIVAFSGFFFSLIYPTLTLFIVNTYSDFKSEVLSFVTIIANTMSLLTSLIMGYFNDWFGPAPTFWLIPICLAMAVIIFFIALKTNRPAVSSKA